MIKLDPDTRFEDLLLRKALAAGATQVHLEPVTNRYWRIRVRCDESLNSPLTPHAWGPLHPDLGKKVVAWLKGRAELDPHERCMPQSGRMLVGYNGKDYGVSVSTLPTRRGEVVTLELGLASAPPLAEVGLGPSDLTRVKQALCGDRGGLVLVAGNRRSGKRTLMRSCTAYLANQRRTVFSVAAGEPDSGLDGVVQVDMHPELGFFRLQALRATLASSPDALRVDLIDTPEIARLVVDSAIRGITVVSSIVATDSAHAVLRMLELGVEPRRFSQATELVVSCRLPRRLCPSCKEAVAAPSETSLRRMVPRLMKERVLSDWKHARSSGGGCKRCHGGFRDRVPVFEVLRTTPALIDRLTETTGGEAKLACLRERTRGLREGAMLLAEAGVTSVVEALRVTPPAEIGTCDLGRPERENAVA